MLKTIKTDQIKEIIAKSDHNLNPLINQELTRVFPSRKIDRILFVVPPDADTTMFNYATAKRGRYWNYPPYGLGIISSYLKKEGVEVQIINLNHEILKACRSSNREEEFDFDSVWKDILHRTIVGFEPDVVGVSCMFTHTHLSTVKVCGEIKYLRTDIPIALGGVHITNCFIDKASSKLLLNDLKNCDYFFLFEAEIAFLKFVRVVNENLPVSELSQIFFNSGTEKLYISNKTIPSEDEINVIPDHNLMKTGEVSKYGKIGSFYCLKANNTKFATILSNRGCRGKCTFCSVREFNGPGVRHRSVQSVIDEIKMLRDEFGVTHVMWLDDDFFHSNTKTLKLLNEMIKQNLGITWDCTNGVIVSSCTNEIIAAAAESGCIGLNIGVESGNSQMLKIMKKPGGKKICIKAAEILRKHERINVRVFLMIGLPGETYRMILDTINLAIEMDLDWYNITIFQPLPNTSMFESMVREKLIDSVEFGDVRYNTGAYGKTRDKAQKNLLSSDFSKDIFKGVGMDDVPPKSQLEDIWFYLNYYLNFNRLYKEHRHVKIEQQFKYVQNIADMIAPDDAFAMYFCGYMQMRVLGRIDTGLIKKLEHCIQSSEYWRRRCEDFCLSINHLKTGIFPSLSFEN